jgi:hypothetical protein
MVKFICNYIKKFSTSDVIKDESKDMGVDHDDQSDDLTGSVDEMDTVDETGVVDEALAVDDNSESVKQLDNIRKNISDAKTKIEEKRAEKAIVENNENNENNKKDD